jgi:anti-anti-sigma factor
VASLLRDLDEPTMPEGPYNHIRCRAEDGVLVLTLTVKQMQGDDLADALRKEFFRALEQFQRTRVVLDFKEVQLLFSAGFRPLLSLHRRLREQGGEMVLCNLAAQVAESLQVTRLISTSRSYPAPFETAASLEEAVAKLQPQ